MANLYLTLVPESPGSLRECGPFEKVRVEGVLWYVNDGATHCIHLDAVSEDWTVSDGAQLGDQGLTGQSFPGIIWGQAR